MLTTLLTKFVSGAVVVTLALLTIVVRLLTPQSTVTLTLIEALFPLAKGGKVHVTLLPETEQPGADTKCTPPGKVSVIVTPVAVPGPMLYTTMT